MAKAMTLQVAETKCAKVAELADAPDLGSGGATRGGSSPPFRTNKLGPTPKVGPFQCAHPASRRFHHGSAARHIDQCAHFAVSDSKPSVRKGRDRFLIGREMLTGICGPSC